jgi:hypothetical protein
MRHLLIEIEDDLHKAFKVKCASEGTTIKDRVTDLIIQFLDTPTIKQDEK